VKLRQTKNTWIIWNNDSINGVNGTGGIREFVHVDDRKIIIAQKSWDHVMLIRGFHDIEKSSAGHRCKLQNILNAINSKFSHIFDQQQNHSQIDP